MSKPLFSFGLITDIQYANVEDGMNFRQTRWRYYRKALRCLDDAISHWNRSENTSFMLQLGDIIDGKSRGTGKKHSDFKKLTESLQKYPNPIFSCWGNHEFYNFSREKLIDSVLYPKSVIKTCENGIMANGYTNDLKSAFAPKKLKDDYLCCFHFSPHPGFRFVVTDSYDISPLGRGPDDPKRKRGEEILRVKNPNEEKNDPFGAVAFKFVKYNGAIGEDQKHWLQEVLEYSDAHQETVVVCGHIAVHPKASGGQICLLWNHEEMLELLHAHPCVTAYFAGHDHEGASYYCDTSGVHHYTFESALEAVPKSEGGNETAFATVDVFQDRMEIRGVGDISSSTLHFTSNNLLK